jgi:membrane fusion protein (multidrug efflux system)
VHPEQGKWVFLDRAVDAATGTLRARAQFTNPDQVLRPGMFARIRISLKTEQDSIVLPQRAVQELQGKNFVWVVDQGDVASQRPVQVGLRTGSDWIIEDGVKAGDRIIVEGIQKARQGAPVQPMTADQVAQAAAAAVQTTAPKPAKE